jgi:hypothetical protein
MTASLRPAPLLLALLLPVLLACAAVPAAAAEPDKDPGTVHINAMKNPELKSYRAIVAGLDKFDDLHALAPNVPQLRFQVDARGKGEKSPSAEPLVARIAADDFSIPLTLDQDLRFSVPRSRAAYDAKAELILNRKKHEARVEPYVRTPGLAEDRYRMGDVRLDCQVKIAIAKEEIPFWANGALSSATLREGARSLPLEVEGKSFRLPIGDTSWGNDAMIELVFDTSGAKPAEPAPSASTVSWSDVNAPAAAR